MILPLAFRIGEIGERDVDHAAVLAPPNGLEVVDGLAAANLLEDRGLLVAARLGNDQRHRLPDRFRGGISEQALRSPVPAQDDFVEVLGQNGVVRRLDDRGIVQRLPNRPIARLSAPRGASLPWFLRPARG